MSIPCKGNGMTLGLTDGTEEYGLTSYQTGSVGRRLTAFTTTKGTTVGTVATTGNIQYDYSIGITTDPKKSGVVADLSDGQIVIIKY